MLNFHVKFVQTDRQTTVTQYAPNLLIRGITNVPNMQVMVKTIWTDNTGKHIHHSDIVATMSRLLHVGLPKIGFSDSK